jgi:hypothetical protein
VRRPRAASFTFRLSAVWGETNANNAGMMRWIR